MSTTQLILIGAAGGAVFMALCWLFEARGMKRQRRSSTLIKRIRQVRTFEARNTQGHPVTLCIYQEYVDAGTQGDPNAERKGRQYILTPDGRHVDKVGTRKYRVMGTTDLLSSEDAGAP